MRSDLGSARLDDVKHPVDRVELMDYARAGYPVGHLDEFVASFSQPSPRGHVRHASETFA